MKNNKHTNALLWFDKMVQHCLEYAKKRKRAGKHLVGITCEYTPRELIIAAGGMPACLCGGDADQIPAAEEFLPSNLCPLIKSTFGYSVRKENPFLEMTDLIVAETTCNGKKKMFELLAERHPMHVLELTQKPDDKDAFKHWVQELRKLKTALETKFGTVISKSKINRAITMMNRERRLKRGLAELMKSPSPPITGKELLNMKSIIACIPADLEMYERAITELPGRSLTPPATQRARVLLTGVPMPHGAEKVVDIIENNGGLIVCQENCTGLKPILEDVREATGDPVLAIAEKYFHLPCSVMTRNDSRLKNLEALVKDYRPDCLIEVIWQACLTYDVESYHVRKLCEKTLKIPYLRIETDYSPSDSARIAVRIQALFETVGGRKHAK